MTVLDDIFQAIAEFEGTHEARKPSLIRLPVVQSIELSQLRPDVYPTPKDVTIIDGVAVERGGDILELVP